MATAPTKPATPTSRRTDGKTIKVRAIGVGFYGNVRRRIGDVFVLYPVTGTFSETVKDKDGEPKTLKTGTAVEHPITKEVPNKTLSAEDQFNPSWMEKVPASTPERARTGQEVIDEENDRLRLQRATGEPATSAPAATGQQSVLGDE